MEWAFFKAIKYDILISTTIDVCGEKTGLCRVFAHANALTCLRPTQKYDIDCVMQHRIEMRFKSKQERDDVLKNDETLKPPFCFDKNKIFMNKIFMNLIKVAETSN